MDLEIKHNREDFEPVIDQFKEFRDELEDFHVVIDNWVDIAYKIEATGLDDRIKNKVEDFEDKIRNVIGENLETMIEKSEILNDKFLEADEKIKREINK